MAEVAESPWRGKRSAREGHYLEKREAVLEQAAAMFAERGFELASLNDLADRLSVTKPTLYYYFRSKDDILAGVLQRGAERLETIVSEAEREEGDGRARLDRLFRGYFTLALSDYGRCFVAVRDRISGAMRKQLAETWFALEARILALFEAAMADGTVRQQDPAMAYQAAFAQLNWLALWLRTRHAVNAERIDGVMALIWGGIGAR